MDNKIVFDRLDPHSRDIWLHLFSNISQQVFNRKRTGFFIVTSWLENTYDCKTTVENHGNRWILTFPDIECKTEFVLTWMS